MNVNEVTSVWLIGIRYKILDANTGEQAGTDYIEETIKITSNEGGVAGVSQSKTNYLTLDSITQRLVQKCVASMDKYK